MGSQGPSAMVALTLAWLGKVLYGYTAARIDFCNETQRLFSSIAVWSYREDALPCRFQRSWWCSQPFEKVGPKTFTRESSFRRIGWFHRSARAFPKEVVLLHHHVKDTPTNARGTKRPEKILSLEGWRADLTRTQAKVDYCKIKRH